MGVVLEIMMSRCPGSLVTGVVMVRMRCTPPMVAEWSDVSSLLAPIVLFGNSIWGMLELISEDGGSFLGILGYPTELSVDHAGLVVVLEGGLGTS